MSLGSWALSTCPNVRDGDRCVAEHARGRQNCRLVLNQPAPRRCPWGERGPILTAPNPVYRLYLALAKGPWWKRPNRPEPAPKRGQAPASRTIPPDPEISVAPTGTELRVCPGYKRECENLLMPGKQYCLQCRTLARRESNRLAARARRNKKSGSQQKLDLEATGSGGSRPSTGGPKNPRCHRSHGPKKPTSADVLGLGEAL